MRGYPACQAVCKKVINKQINVEYALINNWLAFNIDNAAGPLTIGS